MDKTKSRPLQAAMNYIWKFDKSLIIIVIMLGIVSAVLPLINIYIPAKIIGIISTTRNISDLITYAVVAVIGNAALFILKNYLENLKSKKTRALYLKEINDLSEKVFKVEYPNLENAKFEGNVNKYKMYNKSPFMNLLWIISALATGVSSLALSIAMISPFFNVMFKVSGEGFLHSPWYGVAIIGVILVVAVVVLLTSSIINKKCYKIWDTFSTYNRLFSFFTERLNDYNSGKDIRIYAQQDLIFDSAMNRILKDGVSISNRAYSLYAKQSGMIAVVGALVGFGVYSIIGFKGLAGYLSVESVVLCASGMMQIVAGITNIGMVMGNVNEVVPRAKDFFEIMDAKDEVDTNISVSREFKELAINNLSFKYDGETSFGLNNITFKVNQGDKIAVVGQNGSGKSTFIKLLCGLFNPTEGGMLMDGKLVEGYNSKAWKELFSVVFQDSTIFSLPLSQNVAGQEEYDCERLNRCLAQAGVLNTVNRMPKGVDSYLYKHYDDNGVEVSGGEAQKISMARALYKDAPIMILDEPTAALDPFAEQEVYSKFNELTSDKTVFYISHRLSSCYFCNRIVVFDNGNLVQFGSHQELLKDVNGKYYELWNTQAKYYV